MHILSNDCIFENAKNADGHLDLATELVYDMLCLLIFHKTLRQKSKPHHQWGLPKSSFCVHKTSTLHHLACSSFRKTYLHSQIDHAIIWHSHLCDVYLCAMTPFQPNILIYIKLTTSFAPSKFSSSLQTWEITQYTNIIFSTIHGTQTYVTIVQSYRCKIVKY